MIALSWCVMTFSQDLAIYFLIGLIAVALATLYSQELLRKYSLPTSLLASLIASAIWPLIVLLALYEVLRRKDE